MLKRGYLASNTIFLNIFHTKKVIDNYIKNLDPIFKIIKDFEMKKKSVSKYLKGPVCWNSFSRLSN